MSTDSPAGRSRAGLFSLTCAEALWLAILLALPLVMNVSLVRTFEASKLGAVAPLAALGLAVLAAGALSGGYAGMRKMLLGAPVLCFAGLMLTAIVATAASETPWVAFFGDYFRREGLISWLTYGVLFGTLLLALRRRAQLERIVDVLLLSTVVPCVYAVMQRYGWDFFHPRAAGGHRRRTPRRHHGQPGVPGLGAAADHSGHRGTPAGAGTPWAAAGAAAQALYHGLAGRRLAAAGLAGICGGPVAKPRPGPGPGAGAGAVRAAGGGLAPPSPADRRRAGRRTGAGRKPGGDQPDSGAGPCGGGDTPAALCLQQRRHQYQLAGRHLASRRRGFRARAMVAAMAGLGPRFGQLQLSAMDTGGGAAPGRLRRNHRPHAQPVLRSAAVLRTARPGAAGRPHRCAGLERGGPPAARASRCLTGGLHRAQPGRHGTGRGAGGRHRRPARLRAHRGGCGAGGCLGRLPRLARLAQRGAGRRPGNQCTGTRGRAPDCRAGERAGRFLGGNPGRRTDRRHPGGDGGLRGADHTRRA